MHAQDTPDLELVDYSGAGSYAWLRRELDTAIRDAERIDQDLTQLLGWPAPQPEPEEIRVALTQRGRDYLARQRAMEALFGRPWPTVAEACA
jgi:hypothetical protein